MQLSEPTARRSRVRETVRGFFSLPEIGILLPLIGFSLLFYLLNPAFLSSSNVGAMLRAVSFIGIIAVGQTLLMIAGELDLSVGSVAGLCAIVAAWLFTHATPSLWLALSGGIFAGMIAGLVNGLMTVKVRLPAFIATLGMLYVARGLTYLITNGYPIYPIPATLKDFGAADTLGTSWSFLILVGLVVVGDIMLRHTIFGSMISATGGNREAARIAGINTDWVKISCFVLVGALSGLAGILLMARINVGQPEIGIGWELDVIAAVVIGGVSLFGGIGTVTGTFIGLIILQVVRSGLVVVGVSTHWQTVAVGVIMMAAVALDLLRRRVRRV